MEISLRDEKGQAVVEYILVLVVAVSIILGGIYQLNSAFKSWAANYFGNYLACLLETGELPSLSGTGGDSGLCNQFFKPFSLAEGRPLLTKGAGSGSGQDSGANSGSSKSGGSGVREASGSYGGSSGSSSTRIGSFNGGQGSRNASKLASNRRKDSGSAYTGDTSVSDYGQSRSGTSSSRVSLKERVDTRFAFAEERENQKRRQISSTSTKSGENGKTKSPIRVRGKDLQPDDGTAPDSGLTFAGFMRYLIIAAIILALIVVLGGQGLQIRKGMDASG